MTVMDFTILFWTLAVDLAAVVVGDAVFKLQLVRYDGHELVERHCLPPRQCRLTFTFCLDDQNTTSVTAFGNATCSRGRWQSRTYNASEVIDFDDKLGSTVRILPIWPGAEILKVTTTLKDQEGKEYREYYNSTIQSKPGAYNASATLAAWSNKLRASEATLHNTDYVDFKFKVYCTLDYFGDNCVVKCIETEQYTCDPTTGAKVCKAGVGCDPDVSACASSPCVNGTCIAALHSYRCECAPGYDGDLCDQAVGGSCGGRPCVYGQCLSDTCECSSGFRGETCSEPVSACISAPCQHNGTCVDMPTPPWGYVCRCPAGYTGTYCGVMMHECLVNPCTHGDCIGMKDGSLVCVCHAGFTGRLCKQELNECLSTPCMHGGTCVDRLNAYTCMCAAGYGGMNCQNRVVSPASHRPNDMTTAAVTDKTTTNSVPTPPPPDDSLAPPDEAASTDSTGGLPPSAVAPVIICTIMVVIILGGVALIFFNKKRLKDDEKNHKIPHKTGKSNGKKRKKGWKIHDKVSEFDAPTLPWSGKTNWSFIRGPLRRLDLKNQRRKMSIISEASHESINLAYISDEDEDEELVEISVISRPAGERASVLSGAARVNKCFVSIAIPEDGAVAQPARNDRRGSLKKGQTLVNSDAKAKNNDVLSCKPKTNAKERHKTTNNDVISSKEKTNTKDSSKAKSNDTERSTSKANTTDSNKTKTKEKDSSKTRKITVDYSKAWNNDMHHLMSRTNSNDTDSSEDRSRSKAWNKGMIRSKSWNSGMKNYKKWYNNIDSSKAWDSDFDISEA